MNKTKIIIKEKLMNPENTKKLYDKYPKIFAQHKLSMKVTAMCWGIECGDGWYWLIDQLCDCIQGYIDSNDKPQMEATQVKEKFGTLSFYTSGTNEMMHGMVWLAENMSAGICEKCGSTENVSQSKGWIMTRCDKCKEPTPSGGTPYMT